MRWEEPSEIIPSCLILSMLSYNGKYPWNLLLYFFCIFASLLKAIESIRPSRIIKWISYNIFFSNVDFLTVILGIIHNFGTIAPEMIVLGGLLQNSIIDRIFSLPVFRELEDMTPIIPNLKIFQIIQQNLLTVDILFFERYLTCL